MPESNRRIIASVPGTPGLEPINQPLYDAETYPAAGTGQLVFFRDVTGKDEVDTNIPTSGALPNPQQFHLYGIQIIPSFVSQTFFEDGTGSGLGDLATLLSTGFIRLIIGNKAYKVENLQMVPSGHGLAGFAAADALVNATGLVSAHNGVAHENNFLDTTVRVGRSRRPIHIPPQQAFRVELVWPTSPAVPSGEDVKLWVRLLGVLFREVQ